MANKFYQWQKLLSRVGLGKGEGQESKIKKFAFLIHPRTTSDAVRKLSIAKILPSQVIDFIIEKWGFLICSHFKVNNSLEGYLIGVGFTAKRIMSLPPEKVRRVILKAILFAQNKLNVKWIGLGALTTSVTAGGTWLVEQPEVSTVITHGDTYGVAVAEEGIEKILNICRFEKEKTKIAVVGAFGLIGREIAKFLVRKGYLLILIEKTEEKVNLIAEEFKKINLENRIFNTSTNLKDILPADLVIAATSHPLALLKSEYLKKGVIIYDIAQPMNASPELIKERPDIIRIDGAYVDIDGIDLKFKMGPPKGTTFACLVETMMMALEGENSHRVGEIDPSFIEKTKQWAKKYGFGHASFTCFGRPISFENLFKNRK